MVQQLPKMDKNTSRFDQRAFVRRVTNVLKSTHGEMFSSISGSCYITFDAKLLEDVATLLLGYTRMEIVIITSWDEQLTKLGICS